MVINTYQFTTVENNHNYALDNLADQYAIYLEVALLIGLVITGIQIHHYNTPFLTKKWLILAGVVTALMIWGSLQMSIIKTVQFQIEMWEFEKDTCFFQDCHQLSIFRWELTAYTSTFSPI